MDKNMKKLKQIIKNLNDAVTLEEVDKSSKAASEYYQTLTKPEEKELLKSAIMAGFEKSKKKVEKLNKEYDEIMAQFEETKQISIDVDGTEYSLNNWVTIQNYCKMFNIESTSVVTNWIKRGKIPSENILDLKELNNIRLVKAVAYRA
jgi:predicted nucleotide-binding protein (sugar kinase/HSP70/actin superfamily)